MLNSMSVNYRDLVRRLPSTLWRPTMAMIEKNEALFDVAPGSTHNHQAWPGGYWDHIAEVCEMVEHLYDGLLNMGRPLPFFPEDAIVVLFFHDLEKPWRISTDNDGKYISLFPKDGSQEFREKQLRKYEIWDLLTADQQEALKWVEGEHEHYSQGKRSMTPLAAFCHLCDTASARIFHDYPRMFP
jgi:hypothetical protein